MLSFDWTRPDRVLDFTESEIPSLVASLLPLFQTTGVVALIGDMGTGKTTFMRHLVLALGGENAVTSPTFSLWHRYLTPGGSVYHGDLYRLRLEDLGGVCEEIGSQDGFVFIEWADRFPEVLSYANIALRFYFMDLDTRRIQIFLK